MIYYDYKKGLNFHQCHESLVNIFGDSVPRLTTVRNRYFEFKHGRQSFKDDPRSGRPVEAMTLENVRLVAVKNHRNISYHEDEDTGEGAGAAATDCNCTLYDQLGVRKNRELLDLTFAHGSPKTDVYWAVSIYAKKIWSGAIQIGERDRYWWWNVDYNYDPETKQQLAVWVFKDESPHQIDQSSQHI